jgi:hypothetical protein
LYLIITFSLSFLQLLLALFYLVSPFLSYFPLKRMKGGLKDHFALCLSVYLCVLLKFLRFLCRPCLIERR